MSASAEPFRARTMFWVGLASTLAAAAFYLLATYAPDFRVARHGGATVLSKSAIGFAGLAKLLELTDAAPVMVRSDDQLTDAALLIVPLSGEEPEGAIEKIVARRNYKVTLFILPKWDVLPLPGRDGWDARVGHLRSEQLDKVLRRIGDSHVHWRATPAAPLQLYGAMVRGPAELQWMDEKQPVIAAPGGGALLAKSDDQPHYVLTDPDLLNNQGLADPQRAALALRIIEQLRPNREPVMFDETLLGLGHGRSLQKLLVEPPFLALTLSLIGVALFALARGFARFGKPQREERALAFGKSALVETTARLFRRAGKIGGLGERYAVLARTRAAVRMGAPAGMSAPVLDAWLDARSSPGNPAFTELAAAAQSAAGEGAVTASASALHQWMEGKSRDPR